MKAKRFIIMLLVALMSVSGAWATDSGTFKYQNFSVSYSQSATIDPGRVTTEDNNVWINFAGLHPFYESAPSGGIKSVLVDYWLSNGSKGTTIYTKNQQKITKIEIKKAKRETNENPEVTCYDSNGDAIPNVIRSYDGSGTTTLTFSGNVQYVVLKCSRDYYTSQGTVYFDYPEHIHNYDTSKWIKDNTYHWHGCSGTLGICHEPQKDKEVHLYSQSPEYTAASYTCSTCGYVNEQFKAHRHEYTQDWSADNSQHWHECTGTGGQCSLNRKVNLGDHVYDSTLGEVYNYTCATCGYVDEARKRVYDARDYMSFTAVDGDMTIGMEKTGSPDDYTMQYSLDKIDWYTVALTATNSNIVEIEDGQTCYFRHGSATAATRVSSNDNNYWSFTMTSTSDDATIEAGGNIMSLLDATCQQTELPMNPQHVFTKLFFNCEKLTVAPRMDAITSVPQWGFVSMFSGSGIKTAPALSATYIRDGAYRAMFENCKELVSVPALLATSLNRCAYWDMFKGCDKLTSIEIANIQSMVVEEGSSGRENSFHDMLAGTAVGTNGVVIAPIEMMGDTRITLPSNWQWATKIKLNEDPTAGEEGNFYTTFYDSRNDYVVEDGFKAYSGIIGNDELRLTATPDNIIPRGNGVLIHGGSEEVLLTVSNGEAESIEGNRLTGSDTNTTAPVNCHILSYGQDGLAFYKYAQGKALAAHKAYLVYERPAGAPALRMVFEDEEETGIETPLPTSPEGEKIIYNLQGVRLDKLQKGINIVNGKKILVM